MKTVAEINMVIIGLQKRGIRLADCRLPLDVLLHAVSTVRNDNASPLFLCKWSDSYISPGGEIVSYPHFESEVTKIQRNNVENLANLDKKAFKKLERSYVNNITNISKPNEGGSMGTAVLLAVKKMKMAMSNTAYMNCDFIIQYVA